MLLQRVALQEGEDPALVLAMLGGRLVATQHPTGGAARDLLFAYPLVDSVIRLHGFDGPAAVCFADPHERRRENGPRTSVPHR